MKKLFATPAKAVLSVLCIIVIIVAVIAVVIKSSLISKAEASMVALRDAGVSEAEASALRTRLDFEDGRFEYEVDFYSNGREYDYSILAKNGDIISRDIDGNGIAFGQNTDPNPAAPSGQEGNFEVLPTETVQTTVTADPQTAPDSGADAVGGTGDPAQMISLDEAKAIVLADAGLSETDVTFTKTKLDADRTFQIYDIEFYTSDAEYDYEIYALDGSVHEKTIEKFQLQQNSADSSTGNGSTGENYIGVDRAKEIALGHANLSASEVLFTKERLEFDDGIVEYEIEFMVGRTEYDYTIGAISGDILEYDIDFD